MRDALMDPMQSVSPDQTVEGPNPEGLKKSHLSAGVIEEFAQKLSENIIQSFKIQMEMLESEVDCRPSRFNRSQWTAAQEFATSVVEDALKEVFSGPDDHPEEGSAGVTVDGGAPTKLPSMDSERSTEMNPGDEIQTSEDAQHGHPSLAQPGLPSGGSLDYPDAPPTTPLLPELESSRDSFSEKLKGGLANDYPPATPPSTPKDGVDEGDPQVALVEHLMHSLTADDSEEGSRGKAKMEAFADSLLRDIVDAASSYINGEQIADDGGLHGLARRLTTDIITSSLEEAKTLV